MKPLNAAQERSSRLRKVAAATATNTESTGFAASFALGPRSWSDLSSCIRARGMGRRADIKSGIVNCTLPNQ
jgi:hypothetical protein